VIIAVCGNDTDTITQNGSHPYIPFGIESEAIDLSSDAQTIWPDNLFISQAAIGLHAEAYDAGFHGLDHIQILFCGVVSTVAIFDRQR
jgi:hypothetical protein